MIVPEEKCLKVTNMLKTLRDRKKATVRELQELCGYLNFLNKTVVPGRTFTRRMYAKFGSFIEMETFGSRKHFCKMAKSKLKQHHHVKLDLEFKMDCSVWIQFLESETCDK